MAFKFKGVDFLGFDNLLSEEERLTHNTARDFIKEDNLIPIIEQCNRDGTSLANSSSLWASSASLERPSKATAAPDTLSNVEYGLVTQELERGDSGIRSFVSDAVGAGYVPIHAFGSDEQKDYWLPLALATGEKLGCFGLTEPDFGSNPGGMRTRARKVGDEYVLNGEKMWITSGSIANVAIIWAKVEDEKSGEDDPGNATVRGFLVETDRPGFSAYDVHGKWSLRASITSGLSLQDVHIPASNLLPFTGGLNSPLMCLNQARYGISWGAIGAAMSCYDAPRCNISLLRKQFRDEPIASHQLDAGKAHLDDLRDQQSAVALSLHVENASKTRARSATNTSPWPSATMYGWRSNVPASPATSSEATASPTTTPSCAT